MNLGEFLNNLGEQANIDKSLIDLSEEVSNFEINDEFANQLNGNMFTLDSAKHNPTIRNHYFAQFNNGVDTMIGRYAEELPDEMKDDVLSKDKTTQRISALIDSQKKLIEASKSKGGDKSNEKIAELNEEIGLLKTSYESRINEMQSEHKTQIRNMRVGDVLGAYNYSEVYDREDAMLLAKTKVDKALNELNLVLTDDLNLQTSDGTDFFENNKRVGFNDFTKKVLADSKLLKVQQTQEVKPNEPIVAQQGQTNSSSYTRKLAQEIGDLPQG